QCRHPPELCVSWRTPSKPCRNGLQGTNACPRYIPRSPAKPHGGSDGGIGVCSGAGTPVDALPPESRSPGPCASPDSAPSPKSSWMANGDRWGTAARCIAIP
ncbi:unnamed protein product, partial [Ixodes hexagonus]